MPCPPFFAVAEALRSRAAIFAAWLSAPEPTIAETLLQESFDAAVLDMQHGGFDIASAALAVGACASAGKPTVARVPVGDYAAASRLLDAGAVGIIAPMINSAEEARRLVAFTKFPPLGERSWGPGRATALFEADGSDYLRRANGIHLTIAMIETATGLAEIDAILAVPGIDGVYVGPSDLSISLSGGTTVDHASEAVDAALSRVEASARAAGKFSGLFCFSGRKAAAMAARGFSLITIATDIMLMRQAAREELSIARGDRRLPPEGSTPNYR